MSGSTADASARVAHLRALRRLAEAEQLARQALAEDPHDWTLLCLLSAVLKDAHRDAEALDAADAAIAEDPSAEHAYRLRAFALSALGRHEQALEAVAVALRLEPHSAEPFLCQGAVLFWAGDYAAGAQAALRAIELAPELIEGHLQLARLCHKLGDTKGAEAATRNALRLEPDNPLALHIHAVMNGEAARLDDSLNGLLDVGALAPHHSDTVLDNVAALMWHLMLRPWIVLVGGVLLTAATTLLAQWGDWFQPSAVVRVVAVAALVMCVPSLNRLRRLITRRVRAPMRTALRRHVSLQVFVGLFVAAFTVQLVVAITGIGLLVAAIFAMATVAIWIAVRAGRRSREEAARKPT